VSRTFWNGLEYSILRWLYLELSGLFLSCPKGIVRRLVGIGRGELRLGFSWLLPGVDPGSVAVLFSYKEV
jgi:hypothetical protein